MKIVSYTDTQTQIAGKRCDHCGHSVTPFGPEMSGGRSAVSLGAECSRFVSIDIDQGHELQRADLCEQCASQLLEKLQTFLPAFRQISSEHPVTGIRTWSYRVIDAQTGRPFQVSSLFDDGA